MKLDTSVVARIEPAVFRTWNQIAADFFQMAADGGSASNIDAVELCIDADRLLTDGKDADANECIKQLCVEHGYTKVLKFLSRKIQLT